ncbi:bifunctional heptose 7-phosphate kinase/heptose 1-phosphate adenyltransferase [Fulvivirga sedimenti]|uniref:PfkB family carbohydrate kinase n=1 Tax=Fulvivirga sedimenti TaxID=2879465 RepID=A0A9X1HL35_9BACT|nr:bifunctional ADP-heptose synthase [Fulvivirga sedimenti]MCA6074244.1 PfkB family carbohydrate kinase [Fulvivirga sedimenti]
MADYKAIIDNMASLNALVIGDVMVDAYIWGSIDRISPEAPVPVVRVHKRDYRLGGAANVALNVQAMGASCMLCAVIGNDDASGHILERMQINNLDASGLVRSDHRPTTIKTRVISGHQHVVRVDQETDTPINEQELTQLKQRIDQFLPSADVVIFEDYDKGVITQDLISYVVEKASQNNIPVVVDPKKRNFLNYRGVTLFKPNLKELKEGLNLVFEKTDQQAIRESVRALRELLVCDQVMVTLSEQGIYIDSGQEQNHLPAHMREISDVSGAGDTVISIAALATALRQSPSIVAALSNLAGGLVCEHSGVVPINREDLLQEALKLV